MNLFWIWAKQADRAFVERDNQRVGCSAAKLPSKSLAIIQRKES